MEDLCDEDIDFMRSLGVEPDGISLSVEPLRKLEGAAHAGDATATRLLEVVKAAEATQHLFNPELSDMMAQAVAMMDCVCPLLRRMSSTMPDFRDQLAHFLDGVMRDAFARGWLAHERIGGVESDD